MGGNVTAACHHVRPLAQFPAGRESAGPWWVWAEATAPLPAGQDWQDTRCLQDRMAVGGWGGWRGLGRRLCSLCLPPCPHTPRARSHHSRGLDLGVTTPSRGVGQEVSPVCTAGALTLRLCVPLFKDSGLRCHYSDDDKSKSKSCLLWESLIGTEKKVKNPASSPLVT